VGFSTQHEILTMVRGGMAHKGQRHRRIGMGTERTERFNPGAKFSKIVRLSSFFLYFHCRLVLT